MLSLLSIITYLDRVCIAVAGRACRTPGHQPAGLGLGARRLLPLLRRIRDSHRRTRRSHRPAARADAHRPVVVGVHVAHRCRSAATSCCCSSGSVSAWARPARIRTRRRSSARWIPRAARARAWGIVWMTGQIGAAISPLLVRADSGPLRLARGLLSVRNPRRRVGGASGSRGFAIRPREKAGVTPAELRGDRRRRASATAACRGRGRFVSATFWRFATIGASLRVLARASSSPGCRRISFAATATRESALVLSSLPYIVGACANGLGGLASDWLVRRYGLRTGRRVTRRLRAELAALFMARPRSRPRAGRWALVFLSVAYGGILAAAAEPLRDVPRHRTAGTRARSSVS